MRTLSLTAFGTVTLDGGGNGTITLGPSSPGESWLPAYMSIEQSGSFPSAINGSPLCSIYINGTLVDSTWQVTGDASSVINGQVIYIGQTLQAIFSHCNPGAAANFNVYGTRQVP